MRGGQFSPLFTFRYLPLKTAFLPFPFFSQLPILFGSSAYLADSSSLHLQLHIQIQLQILLQRQSDRQIDRQAGRQAGKVGDSSNKGSVSNSGLETDRARQKIRRAAGSCAWHFSLCSGQLNWLASRPSLLLFQVGKRKVAPLICCRLLASHSRQMRV